MVQKKLPTINSAHGSETRNIINELIKLFNGMGFTYNEALKKAHDVLDEAQKKSNNVLTEAERVNAMNKSVQQQINTLIAESGTSDSELLQSRIDADGNEYPVLKERLDSKDQSMPVYAAYYGVSHTNSAADNTNNLKTALSIAENESRPLILPMTPPGEYIEINDVIFSDVDGVHISGYGVNTRIKQTVFPKGGFHLEGDYNYIGNFEIYGIPFDGKGMGQSHGSYSGITNYGSYSTTEKIKGDNFSVLVRAMSRTKQIVDSRYVSIKSGKDVAFNLWHGNSKDCYFDKITGSYSDKTDAPPHLIYIDHYNGLIYNLRGGSSYSYDGEGSFAYQFKGCVGGGVDSLVADNSEGNLHLSASDDFNIKEVISNKDTFQSYQGAGAMAIDEDTKNIVIDLYKVDSVYEGKQLQIEASCENVVIKSLEVTANTQNDYLINEFGGYASIDLSGSNCKIYNPIIKNYGSYDYPTGIHIRNNDNSIVVNPEVKGFKTSFYTEGANNIFIKDIELDKIEDGDNLLFAVKNTPPKIELKNRYIENDVVAYDDILTAVIGSESITPYTSSGHSWESLSGLIQTDRGKREFYTISATQSGTLGVINTGSRNVSVEASVKASGEAEEGLAVRVADNNNFIAARIDNVNNQAIIFKRQDGVNTTLESVPFKSLKGRAYRHNLIIYSNQVDFYIDNRHILSTTLDSSTNTHFYNNTKHGIRVRAAYQVENNGGISDLVWKRMS